MPMAASPAGVPVRDRDLAELDQDRFEGVAERCAGVRSGFEFTLFCGGGAALGALGDHLRDGEGDSGEDELKSDE
jgi:hypothetical protein